ncbi:hypothetical protein GCM10009741_38600 [Kribbella lupini]|uniref:Uncharacterized protein n=1 Tax=Kribbella lupini TaxID=291602 RepID=A0ABP4LVI7_9ACTN
MTRRSSGLVGDPPEFRGSLVIRRSFGRARDHSVACEAAIKKVDLWVRSTPVLLKYKGFADLSRHGADWHS